MYSCFMRFLKTFITTFFTSFATWFSLKICTTYATNNIVKDIIQFDCKGWETQWQSYQALEIGIVMSDGFISKFNNNIDAVGDYIQLIFDKTNAILSSQFNVYLSPGEVLFGDEIEKYMANHLSNTNNHNTDKWWKDGKDLMTGCNLSQDQLKNIRNFVKARYEYEINLCKKQNYNDENLCPSINQYATFVYLADCFYGNGMAPVGTLCWKDSFNAAVVNYERDETWLSFVHELGHIFGEAHYFDDGNGGIMDYDEQQYNGLHQFRYGDGICNGIKASKSELNNANTIKKGCWKSSPNIKYVWSATTQYSNCYPSNIENKISDQYNDCFSHKSQIIKCKMFSQTVQKGNKINENDAYNTKDILSTPHIVNDKFCDTDSKPLPIFSVCNIGEHCTVNNKKNKKSTSSNSNHHHSDNHDLIIDAAFIDKNGQEYLFYGDEYIIQNTQNTAETKNTFHTFPIQQLFPNITIKQFQDHFDAIFNTIDDIIYLIKGREYVRYNLNKKQLIDSKPIKIKPRNNECEFGYIPTEFWACGRIDAAFRINDRHIVLICGTLSYTFNIKINGGFDNMYRPFLQDLGLTDMLYKINAATYNEHDHQLNLYITNDKLQSYLFEIHLKNNELNGINNMIVGLINKKNI